MKKNFICALMSAIALTGAVGFSACSSSEEIVDVNPSYNAEEGTVKTQFSISFPQNVAKNPTRQTAATVQQAGTIDAFRGMDNIVLIPFAEQTILSTGNETKIGSFIELKNLSVPSTSSTPSANSIPASTLVSTNNAVLYEDVTIPVGTGTFLFYGKAIDNTANTAITTAADKFKFGTLTATKLTSANQATKPTDITFTHEGVVPESPTYADRDGIIDYLNLIAGAKVDDSNKWSGTASTNEGLYKLYQKFIQLKAGSSASVAAAVEDLYNGLQSNTTAIAGAIKSAINNSTYVKISERSTATEIYGQYKVEFKSDGAVNYANYPGSINLPDGAAVITWDPDAAAFKAAATMYYKESGMNVASLDKYVYPANLYYWANSTIKTANSPQKSEYTISNSWTTILNKYTDGVSVTSASRSVAIVNPINYGVGRLDVSVKLEQDELYDYHGVAVNAASGFPVTGILIGGQKAVDWNFLPSTSIEDGAAVTIYDNITKSNPGNYGLPGTTEGKGTALLAGTTASVYNHTLALETENGKNVNIAVEFLNTVGDFYGQGGNLIPYGTKFYLVGTLDLTKTSEFVQPDDPESTTDPKEKLTLNKIFQQDYYTTANITIGKAYEDTDGDGNPNKEGGELTSNTTGLGTATNYIPDLRQPQLELGLSIDLTWHEGLTFTQTW